MRRYSVGGGPLTAYPLVDGAGNPAPTLDPLVDWGLSLDDTLEIFMLFAATQAAGTGASNPIGSRFNLASGGVFLDDLTITGTLVPVPEPGTGILVAFGLAGLALRRRPKRTLDGRRPGSILLEPQEVRHGVCATGM